MPILTTQDEEYPKDAAMDYGLFNLNPLFWQHTG
jgi:hypothetical protein